ncbi:helix-turn-helix domain-containing protein [Pelagerythrobacter aerophilus]|uniref:XRE family transcriptional regulator n=1 Tax=Pelagerythrobacter aerophilus TaxID=2306995 RepID=A0A418NLD7_9SPHN|nr:helix-turn-helix transcriptional regulator [Pelagerythrobacter aerophilus]RIV80326.1 XRE family transcriptional regulator [Pelagerythrobacter aerophilus]
MDMRLVIGVNFARLRKEKGLTQEQAAERSGFSQAYIGWLERGRRNPTAISIWMLAQAVDAMPADLVQPIET